MASPPHDNDNEYWSQLVLNNRYGLFYNPTPEILITQVLRRRVQGNLHRIPSNVLCYFRECFQYDFFQLPDYYRRRASLYFCCKVTVVAAGGVEVPPAPAGWMRREGPTEIHSHDGEGEYTTYQKMNSRVTVTEYRFFPQEPNNEIALYRILTREI